MLERTTAVIINDRNNEILVSNSICDNIFSNNVGEEQMSGILMKETVFIPDSICYNQMLKQTNKKTTCLIKYVNTSCVIFLNIPLSDFEREFSREYRKYMKKVNGMNNNNNNRNKN